MKNNENMSFEIKKIIYDKIFLFLVTILVAVITYWVFEDKKQGMIFENSVSLKLIEQQLETYQIANEVIFYSFSRLQLLLNTEKNQANFSSIMNEVQVTTIKLDTLLKKFKHLLIINNPFLSNYSLNNVYIPFLNDMYKIHIEFLASQQDYKKSLSIAKDNIKNMQNYKQLLQNFRNVLQVVENKHEISEIKMLDSMYFNNYDFAK